MRKGNPAIAVAYLRVSTDEQRLGPEAQRAAIEAWAAREGVQVVGWHVDAGVSGGSEIDGRPGLVAALGELRARRAGVLVVAKRDRLARDVVIGATIERAVKKAGARVVAADGAGNGTTAADEMFRGMLDLMGQFERGLIRERTRAALRAKRARGERVGEIPYGYQLAADGVRLEPAPVEQAVIARIREWRAAGLTLKVITIECARAGLVSRAGTPLGITQAWRIVTAARKVA